MCKVQNVNPNWTSALQREFDQLVHVMLVEVALKIYLNDFYVYPLNLYLHLWYQEDNSITSMQVYSMLI